MVTVLIMAGGTGGHIFPALAIADELAQRDVRVVWLGSQNGMETRIVPKHHYQMECISIKGLRGQKLISSLLAPWRLTMALWQTRKIIAGIKPAIVLGFGGFVTGPGGMVAWLMGKPLIIHEQNAISGLTNRILSRMAQQILTAFPDVFPLQKHKSQLVGNPVRAEIASIDEPVSRFANRLPANELNILVVGGSLGALKLNEVVPACMHLLGKQTNKGNFEHYNIRHQSGKNKQQQLEALLQELNLSSTLDSNLISYQVMEFIEDMAGAYRWADIIICRAGALTISEISMVGIASVLVPYPHAVDDHQTANATYLKNADAAYLLEQDKLSAENLLSVLVELTRERLVDMACNAKRLACPNATQDVANICMNLVKSS